MILSNSRKFIFVHIHKTGGGSIASTLEPFLNADDLVLHHSFARLPRHTRRRFAAYSSLTKHSTAGDIKSVLGDEDWAHFYKFAFVRNPIDRAISFYNFCADQHAKRRALSLRHAVFYTPLGRNEDPRLWPGMKAFDATNSFSEFIRHPDFLRDSGMQPQFRSVCDASGALAIDFVGRFEQFDADFATVQRKLGIPDTVAKPENVTGARLISRSTLDRDDRTYLEKVFELDFTGLGCVE